jgi:hypothetical protein
MGKKSRLKKQRRMGVDIRSVERRMGVDIRSVGSDLKPMPQLHIGVPAYREVNANTVTSITNLQTTYAGKNSLQILSGCYIEHARNEIANNACRQATVC